MSHCCHIRHCDSGMDRRLVVILFCATSAAWADLSVTQSPPSLVVAQGDQARLGCTFSPSEPGVKGAISWHKSDPGEDTISSHILPLRGRFSLRFPKTFLSEGDGSLLISDVRWEDAGIYYCKLLMWEKEEEQGNGTHLIVYAHPSQPEIFLQVISPTAEEATLICRTSGFFPDDLQITWHSSDMPLPQPGPLQVWKSHDGISQASLPLVLPTSFQSQHVEITCTVQHPSLTEPLYATYSHGIGDFDAPAYQLVGYLNILKISLILFLTVSTLFTVRRKCGRK